MQFQRVYVVQTTIPFASDRRGELEAHTETPHYERFTENLQSVLDGEITTTQFESTEPPRPSASTVPSLSRYYSPAKIAYGIANRTTVITRRSAP